MATHPRKVFGVVILSSLPLISSLIMSMGVGAGGAGEVAATNPLMDSSETKLTMGGEAVMSSAILARIVDIGVLILENGVGLKFRGGIKLQNETKKKSTYLFFFRFPLGLCVVTCISSNCETGPLLVFSLLSLCCFPDSAFRLILGFPNRSSN